ncbi:MAG: adenosylcobinamide-GDP ribazoletransferase [Parvibaculum sp.]|uniref:adenosylcobinamide-GDP ribazoletransferase n=1 Tax=Parvibaculum sp. TaxID=2024848 RepID=UPI0025F8C95E|nr:adenosylcobinamide-GDP ribazoletransferase [Parvibaculum sp.]MCE9649030.1 adenosylcobinamide-GDP ribazoletransferase [Parvibaculum sp.]
MKPVKDIALAFAFLTRIPVRHEDGDASPGALARAMWAFPLVGIFVGAASGLTLLLALAIGLPPFIAATLAVAASVLLTGGLHEDGLADLADAAGGATRERRLEIMKDSRIGSYGVIALMLALLLRIGALSAFATAESALTLLALLAAAAAVSRAAIICIAFALPHARPGGLSALAGRPTGGIAFAAAAVALLPCLALAPPTILAGLAGTGLAAFAIWSIARKWLGGQTGDVLGACQQAAEIGFLLGALAVSH